MLYLDHAATTPMRPEVWQAMAPFATDVFGNASGSHGVARRAKNAFEEARERAAAAIGCAHREVVFTGGGTESDNLAIKGTALINGRTGGIITSTIEHEAVLEAAGFCERLGSKVSLIDVNSAGVVDPDAVAAQITTDTAVVSIMVANNETGVTQPIKEIVDVVAGRVPIHTDAVQAFLSMDVAADEMGVDLMSLAAHKVGGPKGVGLLFVRDGVNLEPVLHGGGQELGRRSGTSNVMGAVGMATALELAAKDRARFRADVGEARARFVGTLVEAGVAVPTVGLDSTLVSHAHLRFPGIRNETLLIRLDRMDVAVSVGSACASGAASVSHVLSAMAITAQNARESLRFSFGWTSTPEDGDSAASRVLQAVEGLT